MFSIKLFNILGIEKTVIIILQADFLWVPEFSLKPKLKILHEVKSIREGLKYVIPEINETLNKVSVSTSFAQSRLVSVSTTMIFLSLNKSRSRHLCIFPVSMSLSLDIYKIFQFAHQMLSSVKGRLPSKVVFN